MLDATHEPARRAKLCLNKKKRGRSATPRSVARADRLLEEFSERWRSTKDQVQDALRLAQALQDAAARVVRGFVEQQDGTKAEVTAVLEAVREEVIRTQLAFGAVRPGSAEFTSAADLLRKAIDPSLGKKPAGGRVPTPFSRRMAAAPSGIPIGFGLQAMASVPTLLAVPIEDLDRIQSDVRAAVAFKRAVFLDGLPTREQDWNGTALHLPQTLWVQAMQQRASSLAAVLANAADMRIPFDLLVVSNLEVACLPTATRPKDTLSERATQVVRHLASYGKRQKVPTLVLLTRDFLYRATGGSWGPLWEMASCYDLAYCGGTWQPQAGSQ